MDKETGYIINPKKEIDVTYITELENEKFLYDQRLSNLSKTSIKNEITRKIRTILVEWLVDVAELYRLMPQTLYLSISYLDRFLACSYVTKATLQLIGITCMFIACKIEENNAPVINDFVYITNDSCSKTQIIKTEVIIMKALDYRLTTTTIYDFLCRFLQIINTNYNQTIYLSYYLAEITLDFVWPLKYLPSQIATSCIILSLHTLGIQDFYPKSLKDYTNYPIELLTPIIQKLHKSCLKITDKCSINIKYREYKYLSVANIVISPTLTFL